MKDYLGLFALPNRCRSNLITIVHYHEGLVAFIPIIIFSLANFQSCMWLIIVYYSPLCVLLMSSNAFPEEMIDIIFICFPSDVLLL